MRKPFKLFLAPWMIYDEIAIDRDGEELKRLRVYPEIIDWINGLEEAYMIGPNKQRNLLVVIFPKINKSRFQAIKALWKLTHPCPS
jgi:hypothetical protein